MERPLGSNSLENPPSEDEEERKDVSMVAEYADEIFEYMRELEVTCSWICSSYTLTRPKM